MTARYVPERPSHPSSRTGRERRAAAPPQVSRPRLTSFDAAHHRGPSAITVHECSWILSPPAGSPPRRTRERSASAAPGCLWTRSRARSTELRRVVIHRAEGPPGGLSGTVLRPPRAISAQDRCVSRLSHPPRRAPAIAGSVEPTFLEQARDGFPREIAPDPGPIVQQLDELIRSGLQVPPRADVRQRLRLRFRQRRATYTHDRHARIVPDSGDFPREGVAASGARYARESRPTLHYRMLRMHRSAYGLDALRAPQVGAERKSYSYNCQAPARCPLLAGPGRHLQASATV